MSDDQQVTAGPVEHIIPVYCDIANLTLKVGIPTLGIKPGDRVLWQFFGLSSAEWSPGIEFQGGYLGPFASLSQSGGAICGMCVEPPQVSGPGPFAYRAVIQRGQGMAGDGGVAAIYSSTVRLTLDSPGAVWTFTVNQSSTGTELSISPIGVELQANDTVEWVFNPLPDVGPWRPQVSFHRYDGSGQLASLSLGPFSSLTISRNKVLGTGNNGVNGVYFFQASIHRDSDGVVISVSSHDPAIDNRGGVIDPTGGGSG